MAKHSCAGKVWGAYRDVSGRVYSCSRPATIKRNGDWYCWQHDPERVETDKEKCRAKWDAKAKKKNARYARRAAECRVCQDVPTEVLEELGVGGLKRLLDNLEIV